MWEHLAFKLKGLEGVREISRREKPERSSPSCPGADVCNHQVGGAAPEALVRESGGTTRLV